jgi:hypothetical protein
MPFAATLGFGAGQIVDAGTGMSIDDAKRRGLLAQVMQDSAQDGVLENVGEAAGMEGVTIIQCDTLNRVRLNGAAAFLAQCSARRAK